MSELIYFIEEYKTSVFNLNVACGIIAAIAVFVIEIIWMRKHVKKDGRKEEALKNGHVIQAHRISMWNDETTETRFNSYYHAKYQYVFSEKKYIYKYMGKKYPANVISLYYKNNPRHVWSDLEEKQSILAILFYLIPLAVMIIVTNALGGI